MVASFFPPSQSSKRARAEAIKQAVANALSEIGKLRADYGLTLDDYPPELEEARHLLRKLDYKLGRSNG